MGGKSGDSNSTFDLFLQAFEWAVGFSEKMTLCGKIEPVIFMLSDTERGVHKYGHISLTVPEEIKGHQQALEIAANLEEVDIAAYLRCDPGFDGQTLLTIDLMSKSYELSTLNLLSQLTGEVRRGHFGPSMLQQRGTPKVTH